jgi:invasion protein IalB
MTDQTRTLLTRVAIVLGVFILGGLVGWVSRGPGQDEGISRVLSYSDWRLICPSDKDKNDKDNKDKSDKVFCTMTSELVDSKQGTRVADVTIGRDEDKPMMAIKVPLTVLIQSGVGVQFGADTQTVQYSTCMPDGCVAIVPFDDKMRSGFENAKSFSLIVTLQNGKSITLPMSVQGYVDAQKALNNIEARRHSWWRRMWS